MSRPGSSSSATGWTLDVGGIPTSYQSFGRPSWTVYATSPRPVPRVLCAGWDPELRDRLPGDLGADYELEFAADAREAEVRIAAEAPDSVVLAAPGLLDPFELVGRISDSAPDAAIIVLGSPATSDQVTTLLDAGARAYLVLPLPPGQLTATVAAALRSGEAERVAARRLSTYRERIEEMVDRAPVPMFVKDSAGRYRFANQAFHQYVGRPKEKVIGRGDRDLVSAEQAVQIEATDRLILAGQESDKSERDHVLAGDRRVCCITKFPFRDEEGAIIGVAGVITDITERERNEAMMREAASQQDRLIEQLRHSRAETVDRLTLALRKRDVASAEHVSRMALVATWLARLAGLGEHRVMLLRSAAPMHDVGKIAIRDEILQKPGPLTMEERAEMERHARIGFEILDGSSSAVLSLGAIIALTHHENWDGSGYPRGLRGTEIPVEGRICAVADVFDALLSDRPYRPAMSLAAVRQVLTEGRGHFFDPRIVDLLLANFEEACAVRAETSAAVVTPATPII